MGEMRKIKEKYFRLHHLYSRALALKRPEDNSSSCPNISRGDAADDAESGVLRSRCHTTTDSDRGMAMLRKRLTVTTKDRSSRASLQPSQALDVVALRRKTFCATAREQRSTSLNMDANTEKATSEIFTRKHK